MEQTFSEIFMQGFPLYVHCPSSVVISVAWICWLFSC